MAGTEFSPASGETRLLGSFNLENLPQPQRCLGAWRFLRCDSLAARDFAPLEHRLEFVRPFRRLLLQRLICHASRSGPCRGTALRGAPLGLVLGGSEKFADFAELAAGLAAEKHFAPRPYRANGPAGWNPNFERGSSSRPKYRVCASLEEALDFLRWKSIRVRAAFTGVRLVRTLCELQGTRAGVQAARDLTKRLSARRTKPVYIYLPRLPLATRASSTRGVEDFLVFPEETRDRIRPAPKAILRFLMCLVECAE